MDDLYHNTEQVKFYASCRPTYPPKLFQFISSKAKGHTLAWDVATGNGQAATQLSHHFDTVIATDSSPEQISHAPTYLTNVRFLVTPPSLPTTDLHRLFAPAGSVDLITVATALHWLDIPAFFAQAHAVLRRPGGIMVVWCYGIDLLIGGDRVEKICRHIYQSTWPYWETSVREMLDGGYEGIEFPFEAMEGVKEGTTPIRSFAAEKKMGVEELVGFLRTSTGYQRAKMAGVELVSDDMVQELREAWIEEEGAVENKKLVRFPLSLRIGRVC